MNYVIAVLIEDVSDNVSFTAWPLHITLSPIFTVENIEPIAAELKRVANKYSSFEVAVENHNHFGLDQNVPVLELQPSDKLSSLHRDIYHIVAPYKASERGSKFWLDNYRPHITVKKEHNLAIGDKITISAFTLFKYIEPKTRTKAFHSEYRLY